MRATRIVVVLAALVAFAGRTGGAVAQDVLKVSVPQRGRRSTPAASPEWTRSSPTRCN
jgi:hypothetical protein